MTINKNTIEPIKDIDLTVNIVDENIVNESKQTDCWILQDTYYITDLQTILNLHEESLNQSPVDENEIPKIIFPTLRIKTTQELKKIKSDLQWEMMHENEYAELIYDRIEEELNKSHVFV